MNQTDAGRTTDGGGMNNKPTDKNCDTTNWTEFLYAKFDPASTHLDDSDIDEDVYSLEKKAEKDNDLPLEPLTADELHIKSELIESDCPDNELVDSSEQDCRDVVATDTDKKPGEIAPESQCIRDTVALMESIVTDEIHIKDELIEFDCTENELTDRVTIKIAGENNQSLETNLHESTPESQSTRDAVSADTRDKDALLTVQSEKSSSESQSEIEKKPKLRSRQKPPRKNKRVSKGRTTYCCEDCNEIFTHWHRFLYHRVKVHNIEDKDVGVLRCVCDLCGKLCFSRDALAKHRSAHKNAKKADFKYPCSYCERKFSTKHSRFLHEQTHTKNYDQKCHFCDKGFSTRIKLKFHEAQQHNRSTEEYSFPSCSVCGKLFPNPSSLAVHESTHNKDLLYRCEHCNKRFKNMQNKKYHLRICQLSMLRKRRKEGNSMENGADSEEPGNSGKTNTVALSESSIADDVQMKNESTEPATVDDRTTLHSSPEEDKTLESQPAQDDVAVDVTDRGQSSRSASRKRAIAKRTVYCCEHCDKTFRTLPRLVLHRVKVHGIEDSDAPVSRCVCEVCGKVYFNQEDLAKHRLVHNNAKNDAYKYPCQYCEMVFKTSYRKHNHEQIHTKNFRYRCRFCDKGSAIRETIIWHEARKHNYVSEECISYPCSVCGKKFHNKTTLAYHESSHNTDDPVECDLCNRKFKTEKHMKNHKRACSLSKLKISELKGVIKRSTYIKDSGVPEIGSTQHQDYSAEKSSQPDLKTKDESKESVCTNVDKADRIDNAGAEGSKNQTTGQLQPKSSSALLQPEVGNQQKLVLPELKATYNFKRAPKTPHKYRCIDCDKTFSQRVNLVRHRIKAHGIDKDDPSLKRQIKGKRKLGCEDCEREFPTAERLYKHRIKAHGIVDKDAPISNCSCDICGKIFYSQDALARHRSKHKKADERKYKHHCAYCDRSFAERHHKKIHEEVHTKNYKYKCRFCDKGSPFKKSILWHEAQEHNVVSEEISFHPCSICGKKFPSANRLARHESTHNDDNPVKCEQCDKRFKNDVYMKQHMHFDHFEKLRVRERNGPRGRKTTDLQHAGKSQIEPMQQQAAENESTVMGKGDKNDSVASSLSKPES